MFLARRTERYRVSIQKLFLFTLPLCGLSVTLPSGHHQIVSQFYLNKQCLLTKRPESSPSADFCGVLPREVVHRLASIGQLEDQLCENSRELMRMMDFLATVCPSPGFTVPALLLFLGEHLFQKSLSPAGMSSEISHYGIRCLLDLCPVRSQDRFLFHGC